MSETAHHNSVLFVKYKLPLIRGVTDLVLLTALYAINVYTWDKNKHDYRKAFKFKYEKLSLGKLVRILIFLVILLAIGLGMFFIQYRLDEEDKSL